MGNASSFPFKGSFLACVQSPEEEPTWIMVSSWWDHHKFPAHSLLSALAFRHSQGHFAPFQRCADPQLKNWDPVWLTDKSKIHSKRGKLFQNWGLSRGSELKSQNKRLVSHLGMDGSNLGWVCVQNHHLSCQLNELFESFSSMKKPCFGALGWESPTGDYGHFWRELFPVKSHRKSLAESTCESTSWSSIFKQMPANPCGQQRIRQFWTWICRDQWGQWNKTLKRLTIQK